MNEDKRKSARTQGRFADQAFIQSDRRERDKQKEPKTLPEKISGKDKRKSPSHLRNAAEGFSLEYCDKSDYSFKEQMDNKRKPEELRFVGFKDLSETSNGISRIIYEPEFMSGNEADEWMTRLHNIIKWYDKNIVIRGEEYPQPRLVAWFGPYPYTYSGATLEPAEMPPPVLAIKDKVEAYMKENGININYNSVLLNLYRNEKDSVAWHCDNELSMGICPTIASVSLGAARKFEMRPKLHTSDETDLDSETVYYVNLAPGSLIIMDGCMQTDWQHRVPKEYHDKAPRINLTFRVVYPINELPPEPSSRINVYNKPSSAKVIHQPELKYDDESFPPLETQGNKKNKAMEKEDVPKHIKLSSAQRSPSKEETAWNVEVTEHLTDRDKNQNNLNKENVNLSSKGSSQFDSEQNNFNVNEPEKSSSKKFSAIEKTDNEFAKSQTCKPNQENGFHSSELRPSEGNLPEPDMGSEIQNEGKVGLNVNAPVFMPCREKNKFAGIPLIKLAEFGSQLKSEEFKAYLSAIYAELRNERNNFFGYRDWYELEVYEHLNDGALREQHLRVIIDRICSMIFNAIKYADDPRSQRRYTVQRRHNGDNQFKPKIYKSNGRKY